MVAVLNQFSRTPEEQTAFDEECRRLRSELHYAVALETFKHSGLGEVQEQRLDFDSPRPPAMYATMTRRLNRADVGDVPAQFDEMCRSLMGVSMSVHTWRSEVEYKLSIGRDMTCDEQAEIACVP